MPEVHEQSKAIDWPLPASADFWKAVEIYLANSYEGVACPTTVRSRLDSLHTIAEDAMFKSPHFEPTPKEQPVRLCLRLGNPWYPHMKLVIERAPNGTAPLFRADTHDRHIQVAPDSREYAVFREMMEKNQSLAGRIEAAWEAGGLATFKSFLREDLARRQAAKS